MGSKPAVERGAPGGGGGGEVAARALGVAEQDVALVRLLRARIERGEPGPELGDQRRLPPAAAARAWAMRAASGAAGRLGEPPVR